MEMFKSMDSCRCSLYLYEMQSTYNPPSDLLNVIHEDREVVVVDKPAGLLSVPGRKEHLADSLIQRVKHAFPDALLVHRLDMDTSGVMVFALTAHAQRQLSMQFEQRLTKKTYIARVTGQVVEKQGEVDLPLIVDWPNRPLQKVCHETGKLALTKWEVIKISNGETRLRLKPKTGRSHQLRVHCLAMGHPILGDPLYNPKVASGFSRMMLHAEELRIKHPESGHGMKFRVKAPF